MIRKIPIVSRCNPEIAAPLDLGRFSNNVSMQVYGYAVRNHPIFMKKFLNDYEMSIIAPKGKGAVNLQATSAKVLHSTREGWINAVCYHAPADKAMLSFYKYFIMQDPSIVVKLISNLKKAAAERDEWTPFTKISEKTFDEYRKDFDRIINGGIDQQYDLPDSKNFVRPFTTCPFASPNCRALCLNRSGQALLLESIKTFEKGAIWEDYKKSKASRMEKGTTLEDDFEYFFLKGIPFYYGGASNEIFASRIRRTHVMWLAWAHQGVMQNNYNDMLFYEAIEFKRRCEKAGIKNVAVRINGTSDLPVHTLRLQDAVLNGRSLKGRNLIESLGKEGVVCYDYTKDFKRMDKWVNSRCWKGVKSALDGNVRMCAGFPTNYHLSFSWSEINGIGALSILKKGGNVVMVFRKSYQAKKDAVAVPAKSGSKGRMPDKIHVAQLSKNPEHQGWYADVVDGDYTDLRFDDPYLVGNRKGGVIVGLTVKGLTSKAIEYDNRSRGEIWNRFMVPVRLQGGEIPGKITAQVVENPGKEESSIITVDKDLANTALSTIDGWEITGTAMGT